MVAEHSFEGDGFWTVVEEEVAPALTFGADLDPILGNPDDICVGPQDLAGTFTWDGPDDWLCDEAAKIEEEELDCATVTPCGEDTIPLPQDVTGHPDGPPPELIRAPVNAEGLLESLLGGAPQHATWHESQLPAWALGGNKSSGEVHGYPLDLLDPYFKAPVEGEPDIAMSKAQRPAFDETARTRTDCLPGPGAATTNLDAYTKASVLLEGEQNTNIPCIGCEQYATPCAPHPLSFSPFIPASLKTAAHDTAPGEGATLVPCTALCLEVLKPPEWKESPPVEPGGVLPGPVHVAEKVCAETLECAVADACRPGEVSLDTNAYGAPAPAEGTASVELAGGAVKATTAQPKALDPWAKSEAWHRLGTPPLPLSRTHPGMLGMPPREAPNAGTCRHGLEAPPMPLQEGLSASECRPKQAPHRTPPPP